MEIPCHVVEQNLCCLKYFKAQIYTEILLAFIGTVQGTERMQSGMESGKNHKLGLKLELPKAQPCHMSHVSKTISFSSIFFVFLFFTYVSHN